MISLMTSVYHKPIRLIRQDIRKPYRQFGKDICNVTDALVQAYFGLYEVCSGCIIKLL